MYKLKKRKLFFFYRVPRSGLSFVYVSKKEKKIPTLTNEYTRCVSKRMEGRQHFWRRKKRNRFFWIDSPNVSPTHIPICNWASVITWIETRFQKRPRCIFVQATGSAADHHHGFTIAAIIFRVTHRRERERAGIFFGLYSWMSTVDPCPVRHETLTQSDLFLASLFFIFRDCFGNFFWRRIRSDFYFI